MPVITDYLEWRGDVPFCFRPLNDVDAYVVSKIGTVDWTGIVPPETGYVPIHRAVEAYLRQSGTEYLGLVASPHTVPVISRLPETERFGSLELYGYVTSFSAETTEQFSALTVRLPDGRHFITFRGTDDTLVGWKEDCLFAVETETPAQRSAVEYLLAVAEATAGTIIVGGHSKGGNLAVYAASNAPEEVQRRIGPVYDFDGPGFERPFFETPGFLAVKDRIRKVYSKNAIVGTLMHQGVDALVVDCETAGVLAHDGFTWEVNARGFVPYPGLTAAARAFNETMDRLLENRTREERRELVRALFDTLSASGADTLTALTEQGLRRSAAVVYDLVKDATVRGMVTDLLEVMAKEYVSERRKENQGRRKNP